MHDLNNIINPKIAVIVLGILGIIIGIFLFISLRSSTSVPTEDKKRVSTIPHNENGEVPVPTSSHINTSVYSDEFLSVDFPDDWVYEEEIIENNTGKSIAFSQKIQTNENPLYEVSYDTSEYPLEKRIEFYERTGLARSSAIINGINFVKLSGLSFDRVENGELIEKKNQARYFIISLNGKSIIIKFLYNGDQVNNSMEKILQDFLANTRFK